jgi:hypothetical protein
MTADPARLTSSAALRPAEAPPGKAPRRSATRSPRRWRARSSAQPPESSARIASDPEQRTESGNIGDSALINRSEALCAREISALSPLYVTALAEAGRGRLAALGRGRGGLRLSTRRRKDATGRRPAATLEQLSPRRRWPHRQSLEKSHGLREGHGIVASLRLCVEKMIGLRPAKTKRRMLRRPGPGPAKER